MNLRYIKKQTTQLTNITPFKALGQRRLYASSPKQQQTYIDYRNLWKTSSLAQQKHYQAIKQSGLMNEERKLTFVKFNYRHSEQKNLTYNQVYGNIFDKNDNREERRYMGMEALDDMDVGSDGDEGDKEDEIGKEEQKEKEDGKEIEEQKGKEDGKVGSRANMINMVKMRKRKAGKSANLLNLKYINNRNTTAQSSSRYKFKQKQFLNLAQELRQKISTKKPSQSQVPTIISKNHKNLSKKLLDITTKTINIQSTNNLRPQTPNALLQTTKHNISESMNTLSPYPTHSREQRLQRLQRLQRKIYIEDGNDEEQWFMKYFTPAFVQQQEKQAEKMKEFYSNKNKMKNIAQGTMNVNDLWGDKQLKQCLGFLPCCRDRPKLLKLYYNRMKIKKNIKKSSQYNDNSYCYPKATNNKNIGKYMTTRINTTTN